MSGTPFDTIVIGAGAAGLMAALRAGQRGRRVLLLAWLLALAFSLMCIFAR